MKIIYSEKLYFWSIFCVFILLSSVFMHAKLGMDAFCDTANYHLFIGWASKNLNFGAFGAAALLHSYFNPLIDVLNYLTFFAHPYVGAAFHSLAHLASACIIMKIIQEFLSNNLRDQLLALIGCGISLTGAMTISLFGSWTNENIIAVPVLLGFYILLKGIKGDKPFLFLFAGLAFGAATGLKLTAAPYTVGAFFATLICSFRIKSLYYLILGMLLGFFLVDGYFMYLRWDLTENPLFPFANNIFHSPYYIRNWISYSKFEFSKVFYYLSLPVIWLSSGDFSEIPSVRDGRLLLGYIGIAMIILDSLLFKKSNQTKYPLVVFFAFSFIAWILFFRIYRYIIVFEAISGILFIVGLKVFFERFHHKLPLFIAVSSLPFLWNVTYYPNWGRRPWSQDFFSSNIRSLLDQKGSSIVFFSGPPVAYFAPEIDSLGVKFANLYSQSWWDGERSGWLAENNPIDPHGVNIRDFQQVYFLQCSRKDPRGYSEYLKNIFPKEFFVCTKVTTNNFPAPYYFPATYLCSFKKDFELPRIEMGVEYNHREPGIIFQEGWSYDEVSHIQTESTEATLVLCLNTREQHSPFIHLKGDTFGRQSVEILINGRRVFKDDLEGPFSLKIKVPFKVQSGEPINIKFMLPNARAANIYDQRLLALIFKSLLIEK
ncbi:MAG: hypothetical protein ACK5O7_07045 [Holosporales bacterium]